MAGAAVLAAALTDHAAHPYSLWINGVDFIRPASVLGNTWAAPLDDVEVTHAAPGQVSAMTFVVEDPQNEITINVGDVVRLENQVTGDAEFYGWVDTPATTTDLGVGKRITVSAIGAEALLDWSRLTVDTVYSGDRMDTILSDVFARATWGAPGAHWANFTQGAMDPGNAEFPLGSLGTMAPWVTPLTLKAGTLRQVIAALFTACAPRLAANVGSPQGGLFATVDFRLGIRVWLYGSAAYQVPADYRALWSIKNAGVAVDGIMEAVEHTVDGGNVTRAVYIVGGNAAGTGLVTDGTGIPGRIDTITNTDLTTAGDRDAYGATYLAGKAEVAKGSLELVDWTPQSGVYAGGNIYLTNTILGFVVKPQKIAQLRRRYHGSGRQDVSVTYGIAAPSYVDAA